MLVSGLTMRKIINNALEGGTALYIIITTDKYKY